MKISPFKYGTTVSSSSFTNREKEIQKVYRNLTEGINTIIISPRRWGKSSLVEKVVCKIKANNSDKRTVVLDLFAVGSQEEFLEIFAKEILKASATKLEDLMENVKTFFKQIIPTVSFGIDPTQDFSLRFIVEELKKHQDEILNLPEVIAQKKGIQFIICLDEFQNLAAFKNYEVFEKKMRAIWQRQKNVTYCLYGSKRHFMSEIFNNSSKPFYRFGDILLLQKIKTEKWTSFIVEGFQKTGKSIHSKDAEKIPKLMKSHSWYVQQLAHYTWQLTDEEAGKKQIKSALEELVETNTPLYQQEVESINLTQLNLLKAIVKGENQFTSAEIMQKYKLGTSNNVFKNRAILTKKDIIHQNDGKFELLDPAFELWFRKQFFGEKLKDF